MQFNKSVLVVEQNKYAKKIVNAHIFYDLHDWPKDPLHKFTLENCFFRATNIVKNSYKSKYVYSRYGIAFDGLGSWSLSFFGADNKNSSSHTDNCKNNFLILGEAHTDDIKTVLVQQRKISALILVSQRQNFA